MLRHCLRRRAPRLPHRAPRPRPARLTTAAAPADAAAHCQALVQKHDYESFLCSRLYPRPLLPGYFALKAFFLELAMVPDAVSTPVLGQMRLQFWRDAIRDIAEDTPPRHPIALALHATASTAHLPRYHLRRIVDAREHELRDPAHTTVAALTAHAESTYSTLLYLLLALRDVPDPAGTLAHAASHLGVAQCLAVLLRALPFHAARGHLVVPADVAAKHGVRQEEVFRSVRPAAAPARVRGLEDAVYDLAVVANDNLRAARRMFADHGGTVPAAALPVFLAGVPVSSFLARLEQADFDALHPPLQQRDWRLPWQMWRAYYQSQF